MSPCCPWRHKLPSVLAVPLLLLFLCPVAHSVRLEPDPKIIVNDKPSPPVWPDAYTVEFVVTMPHLYLTQPQGLSIPVKAWYDSGKKRAKIEHFGGIDTVIFMQLEGKNHRYEVHPRIDVQQCWVDYKEVGATATPSQQGSDNSLLGGVIPILPDLADWQYIGSTSFDGVVANIWHLQHKEDLVVNTYNFYASADGVPLKFHMFGFNIIAQSHYDEYIYEFKSYKAGQDNAAFAVPDLCAPGKVQQLHGGGKGGWLSRQSAMLMPASRVVSSRTNPKGSAWEATHAAWSLLHPRAPAADASQHQQRLQRFMESHAKVSAHNARPDKTYTMQLGKFADWSEEEYLSILMPDAWRRKQGLPGGKKQRMEAARQLQPHAFDPIAKFKRRLKKSELPKEVDWRGSGADSGVKDQGMCGSCWSFGATAGMEAAWYMATGEKRSFSEQQLVDCSYDWTNNGCDGGDAKPAINYVAKAGGIAIEQEYWYQSTGDFCRTSNFTLVGKFDGFLQVEPRDEVALMEAVYTMGPLSVAMDATLDEFNLYKEGVFSDKRCTIVNEDLDHQVILFGYGTSEDGIDYWLVKNTWSKFWGNDGYFKVARGRYDCGISTDGVVAVVSKHAHKPGAESRRLEGVRRW